MSKSKHVKRKRNILQKQHWKYIKRRYPFLASKEDWYSSVKLTKKEQKETPPMMSLCSGDIPTGWVNRFGHELCEELRAEFIRCGCLQAVTVEEVKEKYGELRMYICGAPDYCKAEDVIDKYSTISTSICFRCGKMDSPMLKNGWIVPCCRDCYLKNHEDVEYEQNIVNGDSTTPNLMFEGSKSGPVDISKTVLRLREKRVTSKTDILKIRPKRRKENR